MEFESKIQGSLPLHIKFAKVVGSTLTLKGDDWVASFQCAWWIEGKSTRLGSPSVWLENQNQMSNDHLSVLNGQHIVSGRNIGEPSRVKVEFSNGFVLRAANLAPEDGWLFDLRIPGNGK